MLCSLLQFCSATAETAVAYQERFAALRVMGLLLFILLQDEKDPTKPLRERGLDMSVISRQIKSAPVIPVYGDLYVSPIQLLQKLSCSGALTDIISALSDDPRNVEMSPPPTPFVSHLKSRETLFDFASRCGNA